MATFDELKDKSNLEKITLATVDASKRLIGWSVYSGFIYKIENFDIAVINSIKSEGSSISEVNDLASVAAGTYYNDRVNKIIYLRMSDDSNPNGSFVHINFRFFFSDSPVNGPHDLADGFDVHWEGLIKTTSKFGVELDNNDQIGLAIDGEGSIAFFRDPDFWSSRYDKLVFENKDVYIYQLLEDLPFSEAKLLYHGKVSKKTYNQATVAFSLKDLISELQNEFPLDNLSEVADIRVPDSLLQAKQRRIYGRVFGHRGVNIDQVLSGYPLTGTISTSDGSDTVTGAGTQFLKEVSPDDRLIIGSSEFTVEDVIDDSTLVLTEEIAGSSLSGASIQIIPDLPKKYISRKFFLAGHQTRKPSATVVEAKTLSRILLDNTNDLISGDEIHVDPGGADEVVSINRVYENNLLKLNQTLLNLPAGGTVIERPSVQNVRINDSKLVFLRDYTYDETTGILTLTESAEFNVKEIRGLNGTITMTTGSRTVTGVGTNFKSDFQPGYYLTVKGQTEYFEVLAIDSDTSMRIRTVSTFTDTGDILYKAVVPFDENDDVLSCDIIGSTDDDTPSGNLIERGSDIVKNILSKLEISAPINTASFDTARDIAEQKLGMVIPKTFDETTAQIGRDLINEINQTIFGSLVQNGSFELEYNILNPRKPQSPQVFRELDVIRFSVETDIERVVKTAIVRWQNKEYDYLSQKASFKSSQKTSSTANYLVETKKTRTINTLLSFETDAFIFSNRWAFLLELGSSIVKIGTKTQGSSIQINDVIELFHEKLYERIGGGTRKLSAVQSVVKDGRDVDIETEDLSNAFNRVGRITENDAPNYDNSTDDQKFINSFITDNYGLIENNEETYGLNLIW